jgi:hypothetical protein
MDLVGGDSLGCQPQWCREQDLNLHAFWALDPKSNASANSAIPARTYFNRMCPRHSRRYEGMMHQTAGMVERRSNLLAVLLLTMSVTFSTVGQDVFQLVAIQARPAACHQHGSNGPDSRPASYRCCQLGHNSAIVQISLSSHPSVGEATAVSQLGRAPTIVSADPTLRTLTTSADPPITSPLRV